MEIIATGNRGNMFERNIRHDPKPGVKYVISPIRKRWDWSWYRYNGTFTGRRYFV